jgi:uncharacterized protein (TIGR02271 family)
MSRTVTALFDSRSDAEAAKARLASSRIDADRVRIIDKESGGSSTFSGNDHRADQEGQGFWASLKGMFMPDEDRHAYGEGISRGSYLLCAEVDEDEADEAIRILDQSGSVDFDQRQEDWRSSGWSSYDRDADSTLAGGNRAGFGSDAGAQTGGLASASAGMPLTGQDSHLEDSGSRSTQDREHTGVLREERIPIVEEQLRVGKREVDRGGARVRSYVREVPVHEQVTLREEHVSVERRPVEGRVEEGDPSRGDMFQERNIEMTETAEEAVVSKEAQVREELVIRKTADERVETVEDTVRRTDVDVDEGAAGSKTRPAFGSFGGSSNPVPSTRDIDRDSDLERSTAGRTDRDKAY